MWKKLYSNSGLILLAILAAGVWTSNLYTFIRQSPKLSSTAETQTAPDVRELGRRVKAKYPGAYDDLTDEDLGRRVKAKYPGAYDDFTDTPAAQLSPTPTPRKSAEEILGITPQPPPGPRLSAVEIYEQEQRRQQQQASPSPTLSLVEIEQRTKELELELERSKTAVDKFVRQRRPGAIAICRDGTYSYSANRRGTCSHHGGVAQWLSR